MSSDPKVCANCHIMNLQYDSWQKSGHHHSAVCADCHLPHGFPGKYIAKARTGIIIPRDSLSRISMNR